MSWNSFFKNVSPNHPEAVQDLEADTFGFEMLALPGHSPACPCTFFSGNS